MDAIDKFFEEAEFNEGLDVLLINGICLAVLGEELRHFESS